VGTKAGGSIRELCNQGCSKGNNDINKLVLCNKRAKFACGQNASQKDRHCITSSHFRSKSLRKITLLKFKGSNVARVLTVLATSTGLEEG
jgi:hypothetical protein